MPPIRLAPHPAVRPSGLIGRVGLVLLVALAQAFDVQMPEFIAVEVVEESPSRIYLVLPPATPEVGQELSDRDLEAVAGGWTAATNCGTCGNTCVCTGYCSP